MQAYCVQTVILPNRTLTVRGVPFRTGDKVEVIVLSSPRKRGTKERYPLRGKPFRYSAPFDSMVERRPA